MPIKKHMAVSMLKKQNKREDLKRKAPTKKDIDQALAGLSNNDQILAADVSHLNDKVFRLEAIIGLILGYDKKLDKFVRKTIKENAKSSKQDTA